MEERSTIREGLRFAARTIALLVCLACGVAQGPSWAEDEPPHDTFHLKNGAEFEGFLLRRDPDYLRVLVSRDAVESINGEILPPAVTAGAVAPPFSATDINGNPQAVGTDEPVTLIQFWATWCPYCRQDLSFVKDLHERYSESGLRILALSEDQDTPTVEAFAKSRDIRYPIVNLMDQNLVRLTDDYEAYGIPQYILVDREGVIAVRYTGIVSDPRRGVKGQFEEEIREVLGRNAKRLPPPLIAEPAAPEGAQDPS